LPPLASLPVPLYPPSSYPPPSAFEAGSIVRPALIAPSHRTGEVRAALGELAFKEPKRKCVYDPEEGVDYDARDAKEGRYHPRRERKVVLRAGQNRRDCEAACEEDEIWEDPRLKQLLDSAETGAASGSTRADGDETKNGSSKGDDGSKGGSKNGSKKKKQRAPPAAAPPPGRASVRRSRIRLPSAPYELQTVDQALRRLLPVADDDNDNGSDGNAENGDNNGETNGNTKDDADDRERTNGNPPLAEIPSSFETAGHLAHVNLRPEALPYKYLIGKCILDKNSPKIRTVVNKVGDVGGEFRTFPMEILAGEGLDGEELERVERLCRGEGRGEGEAGGDGREAKAFESEEVSVRIGPRHRELTEVEVREHGCRFRLDFARVYWNSRLQGEHARLVNHIVDEARGGKMKSSGTRRVVVADAMAGVGPFAVPLTAANASHRDAAEVVVHANDLNPASYEYLVSNAELNRCRKDRLSTYNLDARAFLHKLNDEEVDLDHVIMNLPAAGPEFLDAFRGWKFRDDEEGSEEANEEATAAEGGRKGKGAKGKKRPRIHVHCFGEKVSPLAPPEEIARVEARARERCEAALGVPAGRLAAPEDEFRVRVVRDVGPRKNMLCASFLLPAKVAELERVRLPPPVGKRERSAADGEDDKDDEGSGADGDEASPPSKRGRDS
ncbi:hypothetical protein ACHAWF_009393, partial [Thalassiosira exigua]